MCIIPRNEVAYHVTKNFGIAGAYCAMTADAVRRFQLMNGLKADGIYALEPNQNLKCC
ncbi:peptidoglycan-binding protein [Bacillus velezensis]|uniref:Peptidoglycan binding-like domain-containing protein n=1 Tax=Bacillus velezensis TaxID=492670 RepID=A0A6A8LJG5_BACVE|nr:hypothetical protein CEG11_13580 [Bacillus velezensis]AVX16450.1 peptidoglycan-binding protein [Bacillus sp. ZY-1-1]POO71012.1 peptidoglycan-binding protein [Bacillus amyloliquefaciens]TRW39111.1 peptidoglycan-binding protein [Bacillus sp. PW192]ASZ04567.1 hypothetical protein CJP14_12120 [Bacillus velezensis]